jgi:hypothetical protein
MKSSCCLFAWQSARQRLSISEQILLPVEHLMIFFLPYAVLVILIPPRRLKVICTSMAFRVILVNLAAVNKQTIVINDAVRFKFKGMP